MSSGEHTASQGGVAFGEELRREREQRGLPIEAICTATKLPSKHIRALEAGAFSELPGGVFRKGFLRSYLSALGLEESVWIKRFEECCRQVGVVDPEENEWAAFAENVKNSRVGMRQRIGLRWAGVAAMIATLLIAAWCFWRLVNHRSLVPHRLSPPYLKSLVDNPSSR